MPKLTEAEKAERHRAVESTIGTHAVEGIRIDAIALSLMRSYAEGELCLEQFSAEMDRQALAALGKDRSLAGAA